MQRYFLSFLIYLSTFANEEGTLSFLIEHTNFINAYYYMDTNYVTPQIEVIEIEIEDAVLADSGDTTNALEIGKAGVRF